MVLSGRRRRKWSPCELGISFGEKNSRPSDWASRAEKEVTRQEGELWPTQYTAASLQKKVKEKDAELAATNENVVEIYVKAHDDIVAKLQKRFPGEDFS